MFDASLDFSYENKSTKAFPKGVPFIQKLLGTLVSPSVSTFVPPYWTKKGGIKNKKRYFL